MLTTKIIAPNLWGWLADRTGRSKRIVELTSLFSLIIFTGLLFGNSYLWIAICMAGFSFFWNAVIPSMEAFTLGFLGDSKNRYGIIRVWGSVGFVILVWSMGWVLDQYGVDIIPKAMVTLLLLICSVVLIVPAAANSSQVTNTQSQLPNKNIINLAVLALLFCCILMQMSHAAFYGFFSLYLEQFSYSKTTIGGLWAAGVIAEIVVFIYMHRIFHRFSMSGLLLFSFLVAGLRWLLVACFPTYWTIILFSQLLHAVTFGIYHATAVQLIYRLFRDSHQYRGQALYSSMSFGLGGAIGSLISGHIWVQQGASMVFFVASMAALLAGLILWTVVRPAIESNSSSF